jgi:glycosyltransferase involved in cell wall biosynthesis
MFLPGAIFLSLFGRRVVYDVHEDFPRDIMNTHFQKSLRYFISITYTILEWIGGKMFTAIIAATPAIKRRFPENKTILLQNFPIVESRSADTYINSRSKSKKFAYVGGLSRIRGIVEVLNALATLSAPEVRLCVAGGFSPQSFRAECEANEGWKRVDYHAWLGRAEVAEMLRTARAGIVTYLDAPNHADAQPNKLFEYMCAGVPVIASNFPRWREIVGGAGCGILVDPEKPLDIAAAMQWILDHPEEADEMGKRGRVAVEGGSIGGRR